MLNKALNFINKISVLISEKIIRDIAVLALDYPYYPVTMEEMT